MRREHFVWALALILGYSVVLGAQPPWENVARIGQNSALNMARPVIGIAAVISGVMFAFGDPGAKRLLAGVIFGGSLAIGALTFTTWLG